MFPMFLATLVLAASAAAAADVPTGTFVDTGAMVIPRDAHSMTLLADGRVLLAGGYSSIFPPERKPLASAEIYDPATRSFTATGNMIEARANHSLRCCKTAAS